MKTTQSEYPDGSTLKRLRSYVAGLFGRNKVDGEKPPQAASTNDKAQEKIIQGKPEIF